MEKPQSLPDANNKTQINIEKISTDNWSPETGIPKNKRPLHMS